MLKLHSEMKVRRLMELGAVGRFLGDGLGLPLISGTLTARLSQTLCLPPTARSVSTSARCSAAGHRFVQPHKANVRRSVSSQGVLDNRCYYLGLLGRAIRRRRC